MPRLWRPGFRWSLQQREWVPTPAGVLMRLLPAWMNQDGRGGHLRPSAVAGQARPPRRTPPS
eukprot:11504421-Alexandrium_andersonii.AAC.1